MSKLIETLSQNEINEIVSMYQNNFSLREIERRTSHGRPAITKLLEELGVKTIKGNHYRKYFFNFDFEVILTEMEVFLIIKNKKIINRNLQLILLELKILLKNYINFLIWEAFFLIKEEKILGI